MQAWFHQFRFLIFLLIFCLSGFPSTILAASQDANVHNNRYRGTRSNWNKSKLRTAVVDLNDGRVNSEIVEKVTDTLRDELSEHQRFEVVSKEETRAALTSKNVSQTDLASSFNRSIEQAKDFYKTSNFKEAIEVLKVAIEGYRASISLPLEKFLIAEAYLLLGNFYLGNNEEPAARTAFQEAVRMDPDRELSEVEYPPKTVTVFRQCKEDFLRKGKAGILEIQSSPEKAEVYVNGSFKGKTPLKLSQLRLGEHFIFIKNEGYPSQASRIQLKSGTQKQKFVLEKKPDSSANPKNFFVSNPKHVEGLVNLALPLGRALEVDKVVFVGVEEIGWNHKISARMIDVKYQAAHKVKSAEVLDLPKDTRSAVGVIAADLGATGDADLAKDAKKIAEAPVPVIETKKKKSFWKSPLLWSIVGVVVAGGASSAFLIGKGGGGGGNSSTGSVSGAVSKIP